MRRALHALLLLVAGSFLALSLQLPTGTRGVPLSVALPTLVVLGTEWFRDRRGAGDSATMVRTAERAALAWTAALPLALALLGIIAGSCLYTLAYLRWRGAERWWIATVAALVVALFLSVLFDRVLPVTAAYGLLADLWRG